MMAAATINDSRWNLQPTMMAAGTCNQ